MQSNSTVDCPCTSVQFFITKRVGAAFIGVAYSTDQLETKTKEKSRVVVGRFAMPQRLSSIRPTGSF